MRERHASECPWRSISQHGMALWASLGESVLDLFSSECMAINPSCALIFFGQTPNSKISELYITSKVPTKRTPGVRPNSSESQRGCAPSLVMVAAIWTSSRVPMVASRVLHYLPKKSLSPDSPPNCSPFFVIPSGTGIVFPLNSTTS